MCQFLPSEVARLVLGYLEEAKCHKSYQTFFYESPDLEECRRIVGRNVKYGRGKETLLSILQDYCDLTSNANDILQPVEQPATLIVPDVLECNSDPTPEKPADADSVFKTPDKNNYRALRRHVIRQRNLTKQFLTSPIRRHQNLDTSGVNDSLENRSSTDPTSPSNDQGPITSINTSNQSLPNTEAAEHSVLSSKESHNVEQIISSSTKQIFFDAENRKGTIKAVYLYSPVRKDVYGRKTIAVSSKRINSSPSSSQGKGFLHDSGSHASSSRKSRITGKRIQFEDNTAEINKTPLKDCSNTSRLVTPNKSLDEVDRCEAVEEDILDVSVQTCKQNPDPKLPHIHTPSPQTQTAKNSSSVCEITQVHTTGTSSVTPGWCSPRVTSVTATSIISSAIVNKNILSPTQVSSTPEYNRNPPLYSTCPSSVNSPRYMLSDERLLQVPTLTPTKNFHDLRYDDGKSPKRKSIVPRRRVMSEHPSPGPKQRTLMDFMNFNNLSVDSDADPLATFEDWFDFPVLAEKLADTINKVKNSEESLGCAALDRVNSNETDNDLLSQGKNDKLIHEIVKHTDDALEELVLCFSDKLEYSRDHTCASNFFSSNLLLSPNNFAPYGQSDDIQRNDMLTDHMAYTLNDGCNEKMNISEQNLSQNLCKNPITKAPVIETSVIETAVVETPVIETPIVDSPVIETSVVHTPVIETSIVHTPVIKTSIVHTPVIETSIVETPVIETSIVDTPVTEMPIVETPVTETPIVKTPVIEIPNVETPVIEIPIVETSMNETPSIRHEMSTSDPSCTFIDDTVTKNDLDLKNKLNASKPNESTPVLINLTLHSAGTSALQVPLMGNLQKKGRPRRGRGRVGRQVAKQTGDILNQAVMATINCEPSSAKKDVVQTVPISVPQPSNVFSGNSGIVQNNAVMCTIPNTNLALPGTPGNPPTYIILYQNPVPTVGNTSVPITPIVQPVPISCGSTVNPIVITTPVNSTVTKKKKCFISTRPKRKNLFDPLTPNSNLSLCAKVDQGELHQLTHPNSAKTPTLQIQNVLPNNMYSEGSDHIPVLSIPSPGGSPFPYEKNPSFLCVSSTNSQSPRTFIVSQPLSKITQDATCQLNDKQDSAQVSGTTAENPIQTDNQEAPSANPDLTPVAVNISMESPLKLFTLSPGQLQGLQQGYHSSSKLPVILPKVPGLDPPSQDQRVSRKRKCTNNTSDVSEPKLKRGRPAAKPKLKKDGLFNPVCVSKSPVQNRKQSFQLECPTSEDSRSPRNFFAEMLGLDRKKLQTPVQSQPLTSLSSATKVVGTNNHTRTSHIRALNFSPEAAESKRISPRTSQIVTRSKEKKRSSGLKNIYRKRKRSPKCKKKNAKDRVSCTSNMIVVATDSNSNGCSDMIESYSAEGDLPKSAENIVKTPLKIPIFNKNEWNRISVDDSSLETRGFIDINSPTKQNIPPRPQTRSTSSLSPVQPTKRTRKLSSSNESSDIDESKATVNASSEKEKMAVPCSDEKEESTWKADEVTNDAELILPNELNEGNCEVNLSKLDEPNKVHSLLNTVLMAKETNPVQDDRNDIIVTKKNSQLKKTKATDNVDTYLSVIAPRTFEKKRKRTKSSAKMSPIPSGKPSLIQSLNVITSVALKEHRLKKMLVGKPVKLKSPPDVSEKTVAQCSANDCDKNLCLESDGQAIGSVSHDITKLKYVCGLPSILTKRNAESKTKCSPNSAHIDVESEVAVGSGSQSPSSVQIHQNEKSTAVQKLPSENTVELEEAVTSITLKAVSKDEDSELENVRTYLTKRIVNESCVEKKLVPVLQTPGNSYDGSNLKTPRKGLTTSKGSFLCAARKQHSENSIEIMQAVNTIAPKVVNNDDDELENVKAFLREQSKSSSVERHSIPEVQKPVISYDESLIPITPGKNLINIAINENPTLKDPMNCPTEKEGVNSQELTTKRSNFETDLSREVAETLVAMNELSNMSFDNSSSFLQTPGKSMMKSPLKNIKSGDNILNMVSLDSLLDLVHTED